MTVAASPNGEYLASGGLDNTCSIHKTDSKVDKKEVDRPIKELQYHEGYCYCVGTAACVVSACVSVSVGLLLLYNMLLFTR